MVVTSWDDPAPTGQPRYLYRWRQVRAGMVSLPSRREVVSTYVGETLLMAQRDPHFCALNVRPAQVVNCTQRSQSLTLHP